MSRGWRQLAVPLLLAAAVGGAGLCAEVAWCADQKGTAVQPDQEKDFGSPPPSLLAKELGPLLGRPVRMSRPAPGVYLAAFTFDQSKYPTREIHNIEGIQGRARIELKGDGAVTACFAARHRTYRSESKYSTGDGKDSREENTERWLLGGSGRWRAVGDAVQVVLTAMREGGCGAQDGEPTSMRLELLCTALAANERLPEGVLACKLLGSERRLRDIALQPAEGARAGPWALQHDPSRRDSRPAAGGGDAWLLLATTPGLRVTSEDDRDNASPVVSFARGEVDFVERQWTDPKRGAR